MKKVLVYVRFLTVVTVITKHKDWELNTIPVRRRRSACVGLNPALETLEAAAASVSVDVVMTLLRHKSMAVQVSKPYVAKAIPKCVVKR